MKTAEEILGKNTGMTFDEDTHLIQTHFEYVIKSMEEYANQSKQISSEELVKQAGEHYERNKKLITNFLDWYYEEGLKTPMRFETDHDDIAMMFLTEGNY